MGKSYYCFMPVRDSAKSISGAVDCLINQTVKPSKIIVVEDGSSDGTAEILDGFEQKHPDLVKVIHTGNKVRDYQRLPKLWNMCLDRRYDYHMISAGDVVMPTDYSERILDRMEADPRTVIASGDWDRIRAKLPHGGGRFVRQSWFFDNYTEYDRIIGYETEVMFRAIMGGYAVKAFHDVRYDHLDDLGHGHNFAEFGQTMRSVGYHPLFVLGRCILPFVSPNKSNIPRRGALNMLWKYVTYKPEKSGYYSQFPGEFRKKVSGYQAAEIRRMLRKRLGLQ